MMTAVDHLRELAHISSVLNLPYKARAYTRAAEAVQREDYSQIGASIKRKLAELEATGRIAELDSLRADPRVRVHSELSKILGAGPAAVSRWIAAGITSLFSLREAVAGGRVTLTSTQQLGLTHYVDLTTRIPREEVKSIGAEVVSMISQVDPAVSVQIAGSYRRGAPSSGDVDLLVICTAPNTVALRALAAIKKSPMTVGIVGAGDSKITFLFRMPTIGKVRQIDVIFATQESSAAALLYLTGDANFNEAMRGHAKSLGYKLNHLGLFSAQERIPTATEEDIFGALGVTFLPPNCRCCANIEDARAALGL